MSISSVPVSSAHLQQAKASLLVNPLALTDDQILERVYITHVHTAQRYDVDSIFNVTSSIIKRSTVAADTAVVKVRDELERLLDDDQDMADLCLSRKLLSPVSISGAANKASISPTSGSKISSLSTIHGEENDVKELEMLLEAYFVQIDRTLEKLINMKEYIDGTEDYINIQIDSRRNKLIKVSLHILRIQLHNL
ncbi:hypothetical protein AHAS_Ahas12G0257500 [Arachis hypogaea]